ncbi:hypothetical protein DVH24_009973 [Malus domestica]|uniref:Plant heme peroxidase family profile domain-containing protein n=1 Tax=Malus domestica TaxID=3750 RepID=A0A498JPF9_MALDO|nr:hypothetical protein DVH24_009973 [Malus domestica]
MYFDRCFSFMSEEVKSKHPRITYADLYQLAGVIAVEVTGGPVIDFSSGRKDSKISPMEGRLPDAKRGLFQYLRYLLQYLIFPIFIFLVVLGVGYKFFMQIVLVISVHSPGLAGRGQPFGSFRFRQAHEPSGLALGAPHLREKFCRMGLSNQNIVALSRDYTGNSSTLFVSIYGLLWYWIDTFSLHRLLWSYREGHIQIDLVLIVRGLRNLCSL